jgi:hypothetical protein
VIGLLLTAVLAVGLVVAGAEGVSAWLDQDLRIPVYIGGAVGLLLTALGIPFVRKLSRIGLGDTSGAFWKWWGAGLLVRLAVMLTAGVGLGLAFRDRHVAVLLSMVGVYLIGMFAEAAWLARLLFQAADRQAREREARKAGQAGNEV